MIQEKKFHANPTIIRKLYDKFGPSSKDFLSKNDNLQFHFMKFTVTKRIVVALIQKIRNVYNYNVTIDYKSSLQDKDNSIPDIKQLISDFKEVDNLIAYYSAANNNEYVQKVISYLNQIVATSHNFKQNNLEFLVFIRNTFNFSCQSLKKTLNDQFDLGLSYNFFYDKLLKSIQEQLKMAEILLIELDQIICINKTNIHDYECDNMDNNEEADQKSIIEKFVKVFISNLT